MMHAGDEAAERQRHVLWLFRLERRELHVQVAREAGLGVCRCYGIQVMDVYCVSGGDWCMLHV